MSHYKHVVSAAQAVAKRYHDGITGLAVVMGKNRIILGNKLNPNTEQNQLTSNSQKGDRMEVSA